MLWHCNFLYILTLHLWSSVEVETLRNKWCKIQVYEDRPVRIRLSFSRSLSRELWLLRVCLTHKEPLCWRDLWRLCPYLSWSCLEWWAGCSIQVRIHSFYFRKRNSIYGTVPVLNGLLFYSSGLKISFPKDLYFRSDLKFASFIMFHAKSEFLEKRFHFYDLTNRL